MPAIQDAYSIHVSNRFALSINDKDGYESDTYIDVDPLEQLRLIEEQQKQNRESKKKGKQVEPEKPVPKKEVQFKENKNANVQSKKHSDSKKEDKNEKIKSKKESLKNNDKIAPNRDRQPAPGEENRRPRRQNNQRWEKQPPREKGEGDQFGGRFYDDPSERSYRKGTGNADGEGRMDRGGNRYERYRGNRGSGFRGGSRGGSFGYRSNFRSDGRDDRGKREFDRRSGSDKSGVRPVDKRDGAGPRNWGTPGNEIEEILEPTFENEDNGNWADQAENETNQKSGNSDDNENKKDEIEASPVEEKAPTEMTLDEWKKMQNSNVKKKHFNIRRPGEGEDSSKWKGMKVIHESTAVKPVHHHVVHEDNPKKGSKQTIDVDIRFDTPRSGRGGRGGRGFRGGGGGRGGFRGGQRGSGGRYGNRYNNQAPPPDVLNEKEFPTLPAA